MTNKITTVIFDMGGVLLKTIDFTARDALAERLGVTRRELELSIFASETSLQSEIGQITDKKHWEAVMRTYNQPIGSYQSVYDDFFSGDAIDEDLLNYIKSLKERFQIGLLSNAWVNARPLLKTRFNFIDVFDVSLFSYEVGLRKPDVKIYQLMAHKMDIKHQEALFIDDLPANVDGAKAAGMQAIHFKNTPSIIKQVTNLTKS